MTASTLPSELLAKIYEHDRNPKALETNALVCRDWLHAARGTPSLWAQITIDRSTTSGQVRRQLYLSRGASLHINAYHLSDSGTQWDCVLSVLQEYERIEKLGVYIFQHTRDEPGFASLVSLLCGTTTWPRLRLLSLCAQSPTEIALVAPLLERVELDSATIQDWTNMGRHIHTVYLCQTTQDLYALFCGCPKLPSLKLDGPLDCDTLFALPRGMPHQIHLTTLTVQDCDISILLLLRFLAYFPGLRYLILRNVTLPRGQTASVASPRDISLSNLTRLSISSADELGQQLEDDLLPATNADKLLNLSLNHDLPITRLSLGRALQTLRLASVQISAESLHRVISGCECLSSLCFEDISFTPATLGNIDLGPLSALRSLLLKFQFGRASYGTSALVEFLWPAFPPSIREVRALGVQLRAALVDRLIAILRESDSPIVLKACVMPSYFQRQFQIEQHETRCSFSFDTPDTTITSLRHVSETGLFALVTSLQLDISLADKAVDVLPHALPVLEDLTLTPDSYQDATYMEVVLDQIARRGWSFETPRLHTLFLDYNKNGYLSSQVRARLSGGVYDDFLSVFKTMQQVVVFQIGRPKNP